MTVRVLVAIIIVVIVIVIILVFVIALIMVPPEVRDDLLELASLLRCDHAAVDAQRRQRRLVRLAPPNSTQDEVEVEAQAGHPDVVEIQHLK